ncbi:MAG TPA: hypothetical protein VM262_09600 [Acidimicrobiales bacterium]|nr:hypothetical protein [Acidimicrobiales bacterium]
MSRGVRLGKPWVELTPEAAGAVGGYMGVYELADADGTVVRVGYAGGSSRFGLRGVLQAHAEAGDAAAFRYEVTTAYLSRYRELLMVHLGDRGRLPAGNDEDPDTLGRLRPS